jgi:hypothetical protein
MKTAAAIALLLLPLAAAAEMRVPEDALRGQNAQYQQGFRDGFREAMRMMDQGGSGGSGGQSRGLRIESAVYGSDRRRCDLTRQLAEKANGQREYRFQASNIWCGDPDRGKDKVATVRFSCSGRSQQATVKEGDTARLRCD